MLFRSAVLLVDHGKTKPGKFYAFAEDGVGAHHKVGFVVPDGGKGGAACSGLHAAGQQGHPHPEGGKHPVLWWRGGETRSLFSGDSIEGLASDGRNLFAIEDVKQNGRLLKYDPETKETMTLRDGLEEGEGVTVCPDGRLFYTEKKKGWIKKFSPGNDDEVIARGLQAPSFLLCNTEGLWITEDLTHRARFLLLDYSGAMHTILSHLRSPQTILSIGKERLLVAEQGRGRILEVK